MIDALKKLGQQVTEELAGEGVSIGEISVRFAVDMRYYGQGFEITMPVDASGFETGGLEKLCDAFDAEHRRMFTFNMDTEHEVVNLRAVALGRETSLPALEIEKGDGNPNSAKIRDHEIWSSGSEHPAVIYDRSKLRAGDKIKGAAIVTEMDSTTLILPEHVGEVDAFGNILIAPV